MTMFRLVLRNLWFHRRMHAGVLLGTLLASAILTGALVVGDSVDYSLRRSALARLGGIHFAIDARPRFFSEDLTDELRKHVHANLSSALTLRGMAISGGEGGSEQVQANRVNVVGVPSEFWAFDPDALGGIDPGDVAINERLAHKLGVRAGDEVALRIERADSIARDAPLSSHGEDASVRVWCTVRAVLSDAGLGRFSLSAEQTPPYNAFVNLSWLQERVGLGGDVNLVLVGENANQDELDRALRESWELEHVGLRFRRHPGHGLQLESDRVYLDEAIAEAALELPGAQGSLTYLVNTISKGNRQKGGRLTPYSFVVAGPGLGPAPAPAPATMSDDEVIINQWLAAQLDAAPGDEISVAYYELSSSNEFIERQRTFKVFDVATMESLSVERALAPEFPGLSDVDRCEDWNVGIPMDEELLKDKANEAYWEEFGQTPKALFTLAAGQALWGNRFGDLMAVRYPEGGPTEAAVRDALQQAVNPAALGLAIRPVRAEALQAVSQAMDLGGLFLGMSFFLIVSALILTGLLFVFGVQQRAEEMGVLLAVGFRPRGLRRALLSEAAVVALLGAGVGAWVGTLYTRLLIVALTRYWQGAVADAAIAYFAAPTTAVRGAGISVVCALLTVAVAMRRQTRHPARDLLAMDFTQDDAAATRRRGPRAWIPLAGFALAAGVSIYALAGNVDDVVMPFFLAGSLFLLSGVMACRFLLGRLEREQAEAAPTLLSVALQNASRRRGRSLSVVALLATGSFLVLAVSSMQEDITAHATERWSGTGGFELFVEATVPLTEGLADALEEPDLQSVAIRVRDGDDASCLNLNRAQTPRLLGVDPKALSSLRAFLPKGDSKDLWQLLNLDLPNGAVPGLVGDSDTAMWGLQKKTGVEDGDMIVYRDEDGAEIPVKLVGRLPMRLSVFQGTVLISNDSFTRLYPSESGFRLFLIDTPPGAESEIAALIEKRLQRFGADAIPAVERLRQFYVVESTYLTMFLVLGGLGLILGSTAIGVVVLRNLLERRREIAILRAVGFRQRDLYRILFAENGLLLAMGLAVGGMAAAVSMYPAVFISGTNLSLGLQGLVLVVIVVSGLACIAAGLRGGLASASLDALRDE